MRRIFGQISSNLPEKILGNFYIFSKQKKTFFEINLQKKGLHTRWAPFFRNSAHVGRFFSNQATSSATFARIFSKFAQIFRDFAKVFTDFAHISMFFAQIFRDFARIFDKW